LAILFSTTGAYSAIGREALDGALMALSEVNADPAFGFRLRPDLGDPGGVSERYAAMAQDQLKHRSCRHILGGITSWSRKDMIPVVERHNGLLWYAFPYEGYEANDHVLYLGACPNQHIVPLFDHVLPRFGTSPFLVGANYIWGWEINRIARELVVAAGGDVVGERCLPLGNVDVAHLIAEIRATRPDFVLCNLLGPSCYAFLRAYAALGLDDPDFAPERRPVVSCNLTEVDLAETGPAAIGHLTTSIYFDSLATPENQALRARAAMRHGSARRLTACFVAAYTSVHVLAEAIRDAGTDDPAAVRAVAMSRQFATPLGPLRLDAQTNHTAHRPHLGRAVAGNAFEVIDSAAEPVAPDPYLVRMQRQRGSGAGERPRARLRVVP
jgi:branched-chain amino acid transport system substrate-binding protein